MNIENINSIIPVSIEKDNEIYAPKIGYIKNTNKWRCNYSSDINLLFFEEWESLEELIWKVREHIESKEYGEIYNLTYNFKEYELWE